MKIWKVLPVLFLSILFILANSVYATNVKTTALVEETAPIATDLVGDMIDDPGGTPISKKVTFANLFGSAANIGASTVVTTGALDSGSITSNFGTIDNGASNITTTGDITGGTHASTSDTASDDNASMGYTAAEGLILTGQGSTNDITIKNDADADVIVVPTGTTNVDIVGDTTAATFAPDGDTSAGDSAAIGYTATEGIVITGQGSTNDVTIKNDADAIVVAIPTGTTNFDIVTVGTAATFEPDGDTSAADNAAIGYTAAEGLILTGQGSTNDITIKNDADADVITILTGATGVVFAGATDVSSGIVTGPSGTWDTGGIDIATTDTYAIAGTNVIDNATTFTSTMVTSSLTTVGVLTSGSIGAAFGVIDNGASNITTTGTVTGDDMSITAGTITVADGGTVTRGAGDRTNAVTLSTYSGQITTDDDSLAAGAEVTFVVTNTVVTAVDVIAICIADSPDADSEVIAYVDDVGAGTYSITLSNLSGNADTGAIVINVVVLRGASS